MEKAKTDFLTQSEGSILCGAREKVDFFPRHFVQIMVHSHVTSEFPFVSNINAKV